MAAHRVNWVLPVGVGAVAVTYVVDATANATVRGVVAQTSSMVLMFLMMLAFRATARLAGLPRPTARFWRTTAWAMCAYGVGMAFDLASLVSHLALGLPAGSWPWT